MAEGRFAEVIRRRRKAMDLNQEQLAAILGISRNTVAGWETGHARPDLNMIPLLCRALRISLNTFFGLKESRSGIENRVLEKYFALEEGDRQVIEWQMEALAEKRAAQREQERGPAAAAKAEGHPGMNPMVMTTWNSAEANPEMNPAKKPRRKPGRAARETQAELPEVIPVFMSELAAAAGVGFMLDEARGEEMLLIRDAETEQADEVIAVSGRSMEPTFFDGDLVLVKHTEEIRPGEIGIFVVDGEGFIKEYRPEGLKSHNPDYPMMTFTENQDVRCVGKVIGKLDENQIPTAEQLQALQEAGEIERRTEK